MPVTLANHYSCLNKSLISTYMPFRSILHFIIIIINYSFAGIFFSLPFFFRCICLLIDTPTRKIVMYAVSTLSEWEFAMKELLFLYQRLFKVCLLILFCFLSFTYIARLPSIQLVWLYRISLFEFICLRL